MSLQALMRDIAEQQSKQKEGELTEVQKAGMASTLLERYASINVAHDFHPGQLIQWKYGCRHKRLVGPFVVTKLLGEVIKNLDKDSGSVYFGENLDLVAGFVDSDGDFVEAHLDSRRMEPYTGKLAEEV